MIDLMQQIFGTYTPNTYINEAGEEIIAAGAAGVDWQYVGGVVLFAVALLCCFKLIGTLLKGR